MKYNPHKKKDMVFFINLDYTHSHTRTPIRTVIFKDPVLNEYLNEQTSKSQQLVL